MKLKELRKSIGMTQYEAAKSIGVSINTYILWEQEVGYPSPENQEKLDSFIEKIKEQGVK